LKEGFNMAKAKKTTVSAVKETVETVAEIKETPVKKTSTKKAAPKKVAPKKPAAVAKAAEAAKAAKAAKTVKAEEKPAETKINFFIEYGNAQVAIDEVINNIKLTYGKDAKKIDVYLKPEESKAYFVADGEEGEMDVFFC
jgi:cell division septation protein DedD